MTHGPQGCGPDLFLLFLAEAKIPSDADGVAIHAIAIDFERHRKDDYLSFYVEFDGIDEAHRPGIVLDYIPAVIEGQWRRDPVPYGIDGRSAERDALRALGEDGEIDALTEAVVHPASVELSMSNPCAAIISAWR